MPTNPKGRTGRPWRRAKDTVEGDICCLCGHLIPPNEQLRIGRYIEQPWNHPLARTVHHIVSLEDGGHPTDPNNLAPAHRHCNSGERKGRPTTPTLTPQPKRSRNW